MLTSIPKPWEIAIAITITKGQAAGQNTQRLGQAQTLSGDSNNKLTCFIYGANVDDKRHPE